MSWADSYETTNSYMSAYRVLGSVRTKFQKYQYMNRDLKRQLYKVLREGSAYSQVLNRLRALTNLMKDEYLWALALIIERAKKIYMKRLNISGLPGGEPE